jgi:hypothetical protein
MYPSSIDRIKALHSMEVPSVRRRDTKGRLVLGVTSIGRCNILAKYVYRGSKVRHNQKASPKPPSQNTLKKPHCRGFAAIVSGIGFRGAP